MANIKSKKKSIVKMEENRVRNMSIRSRLKTMIKKAESALTGEDAEQRQTAVRAALSAIDRAASKGVMHRNTAARHKSQLQRRLS
jgi:small subunit ribosomal protein S20